MDYAYQGKHLPTKLAAMATSSNSLMTQEQPWLADSAATDHVTSKLNHLNFPKPYTGQKHLTMGNGQNLPITHIGNSLIPSTTSTFQLRNVLRVLSIASNLALIHKICHDNNYWCCFDENTLSIQALAVGKVLYKGRSEGGVYPIYPHKATLLFFLINCAILSSFLLLAGLCGTTSLAILMLKLLDFCCKIMVCLVIIVLMLSILVFIVFMVKCIDYHFLVQDL